MSLRTTLMTSAFLVAALGLSAQTPVRVPVPVQLTTAKTIFLAKGSTAGAGGFEPVMAEMAYTSVYKALNMAGRYELQPRPAGAELSMVISVQNYVSSASGGSSFGTNFLRLEIYDTATHALLWTLDEPVNYFNKKDVGGGVTALMDDLKTLAAGTIPGSPDDTSKPESTKTRLSDKRKK